MKALYLIACCLLLACASQTDSQSTAQPAQPPNIIFILADDLGYGDLSFNGQTHFNTPNIDRLAKEGLFFTQHYAGSTVCAPSRSAIMTGLHTGHTPIRGNKEVRPEGQHPLPAATYTLTEMLKDAGYVTGVFGKWGLGYPGSEGDPNNQGVDQFFGYNCQRYAHHYYPRHLWDNEQKVMIPENEGKQKGLYAPQLIQEKTLAFIDQHQDTSFFLFVTSTIPHAELVAPEAYMEPFRGELLPEKQYEGYDEGEDYRNGPYESQAECHAAFAAMVTLLDEQVGEIMDKLEALGLSDNTLIIFSSDNGPHQEGGADPDYFDSNGPLKGYKRDLYEGGIRVPTIARWKGTIAPDTRTDHISAFWDIMPTLSELTGATAKTEWDGISFVPTLTGQGEQPQHDFLYWEFHERGGRIAVRKGKWKGLKYDYLENPESPLELYDLESDIGETQNVAAQHPEVVQELEAILDTARTPSEVFVFDAATYLDES